MVRKTDSGYAVYSKSGRRLSRVYATKAEADRRLKQIEFFKYREGR